MTAPDRWRLALLLAMALRRDAAAGVDWGEMAVLTMSRDDAAFLRDQLSARDIPVRDLENWDGHPDHRVKIDTVQRAKGLDFTPVYTPVLRRSITPRPRSERSCADANSSSPRPEPATDSG